MFSFKKYLLIVYRYGKKTPAYYYFDNVIDAYHFAAKYKNSPVHEFKIYKL